MVQYATLRNNFNTNRAWQGSQALKIQIVIWPPVATLSYLLTNTLILRHIQYNECKCEQNSRTGGRGGQDAQNNVENIDLYGKPYGTFGYLFIENKHHNLPHTSWLSIFSCMESHEVWAKLRCLSSIGFYPIFNKIFLVLWL